jgi:hypothetical protein
MVAVKIMERLEASNRKLTERLLEIVKPVKPDTFPRLYGSSVGWEADYSCPRCGGRTLPHFDETSSMTGKRICMTASCLQLAFYPQTELLDEYESEIREKHTGALDE